MNDAGLWITPLALLPGVALLVMSTAARFGQLHAEIHHHLDHEHDHRHASGPPGQLLERATLLRNALVSLYVAVALLAVASLTGGVALLWMAEVVVPVVALTSISVLCVAIAAYCLIQESRMLLGIIHAHVEQARAGSEPS